MTKNKRINVKNITAFFLALIMAISFTACGENKNIASESSENEVSSKENISSDESTAEIELSSEYPSSNKDISSGPSSDLSSIVSRIDKVNTSSKQNKKPASSVVQKPVTSKTIKPPVSSTESKPVSSQQVSSKPQKPKRTVNHKEMKAVWLAFLEFQAFKGSSKSKFTSKINDIFDNIAAKGLNTIIVQVRPHGDSFYPSEYYPWSKCISGTMGVSVNYDPLEIMVKEAHARGLSIHAWINPYRTMTDSEMTLINNSYPVKKWYDSSMRNNYMIKTGDGRWWLKPGNSEVQSLIINGVSEIVQNYSVDGIHLDDYFYNLNPVQYGDTKSKAHENTSELMRGLYQTIKAIRSSVLFGVSPSGAFRENQALPSSDIGNLSTDLELWCTAPGYIDYVMPQIYWEYSHSTQPYTMTLNKWEDFVTEPSVALYIGLAPYKLSASVIESQAADALASSRASGYCLFRYDHIHSLDLP